MSGRSVAVAVVAALLACGVSLGACGSAGKGRAGGAVGGLVPIGAGLRGPAGLSASVYARGPQTLAAFALDPAGRLWLTAAGLDTHAHDGVYEVARPGAPVVKVVSGLEDPLGLDWHAGTLLVASLGRVDAFSDFDGTRFLMRRRVLDGPVAGGENNLLAMTPDGRLIMGVTASCDDCVPRSIWSGSIVTFRPDGSDLRLYATRMRAPFGLAYVPGTSDLLVTMNQPDDLGARTPGDWLALVREGEDWRFPGCHGQGGAACAGVPRPLAVLDRHAAVGAVTVVDGQLGASVGTAALVAEWSSGKVQRVTLHLAGAGLVGSLGPFLAGIANPLALALAPDGALLVGDWANGTIYRVAKRPR